MRHEFRNWLERVDTRNLVFVDEAGVNLGLNRLYGRAVGGERVTDSTPRNTGLFFGTKYLPQNNSNRISRFWGH